MLGEISILEIFNPIVLIINLAGVAAGIIFGFLPGLSGTMAVALVLPFTFGLDPIPALTLLVAVYVGSTYGGAVTAILIRTPGTPSAVVTTLDGYPMAQQGRAKEALSAAVIVSFFGGIISAAILIFSASKVAKIALNFGPAEYFAIGLFGLSIVTTLSAKNMKKGIFGACFGIMLGTIGVDPVGGLIRYTFGNKSLMAGLQLVAVIIGIFAISEILTKLSNVNKPKDFIMQDMNKGKIVSGRTLWANKINIIRSSIIGTVVGMIPGTGGGTAAWISYNETMRNSKDKDSFGKGNVAGLIASESANNGVTGGAIIPLLTLGVPGDSITAVMLGALMIQGLAPGPSLFQEHGDIVTGIYIMLIIANVFMLILGMVAIPAFIKVLRIPESILMSSVLLLCVVGSFAMRNNIFDVKVAVVIGIVGFFYAKAGFPIPPVVIGMVLGSMVESNFRRTLIVGNGSYAYFMTRPIAAVFICIAVFTFFYPVVKQFINKRKNKETISYEN
ncbi:MAG: tripartite tricarboxylate transporter permease [Anaerovoracaceae bacterium]